MQILLNYTDIEQHHEVPFIDSGTTYIQLTNDIFEKFKAKFEAHCAQNNQNCAGFQHFKPCYYMNEQDKTNIDKFKDSFPKLTFSFDGPVDIELSPQQYLLPHPSDREMICVGVAPYISNVFGAVFLRGKDVLVDRKNKLITFVQADCPVYYDTVVSGFSVRGVLAIVETSALSIMSHVWQHPVFAFLRLVGLKFVLLLYGSLLLLVIGIYWCNNKQKTERQTRNRKNH